MIDKTIKKSKINKTTTKRLPKGQRAHVRRVKQEARKSGTMTN
jgi:hypothetical protein